MTSVRRLRFLLCFLFALLALSTDQGCGQDAPPRPTTFRVLVPQKRTRILIDSSPTASRSVRDDAAKADAREVVAPELLKGKREYQVTASWRTNDYTRFYRTRKVAPKPGGTIVVDLREADPKNPDHIEIRYVPTPQDVAQRMCKLGKVGKDDVVYDLGCGDGRLVLTAVEDFHAKRGVGIDLDPQRIDESTADAKRRKLTDKVKFRVGDVLKVKDLSDASVVLLYMGDDVNLRLRPILQKTLKPGSRIVSHRFEMGDWKPDKSITFEAQDGEEYTIHLWTIPSSK